MRLEHHPVQGYSLLGWFSIRGRAKLGEFLLTVVSQFRVMGFWGFFD